MSVGGVFLFVTSELSFIEVEVEAGKVKCFFLQRTNLGNRFTNFRFSHQSQKQFPVGPFTFFENTGNEPHPVVLNRDVVEMGIPEKMAREFMRRGLNLSV